MWAGRSGFSLLGLSMGEGVNAVLLLLDWKARVDAGKSDISSGSFPLCYLLEILMGQLMETLTLSFSFRPISPKLISSLITFPTLVYNYPCKSSIPAISLHSTSQPLSSSSLQPTLLFHLISRLYRVGRVSCWQEWFSHEAWCLYLFYDYKLFIIKQRIWVSPKITMACPFPKYSTTPHN